MKRRIAILTGGTSSEREVALESAYAVCQALEGRYDLCLFDLPKDTSHFVAEHEDFEAAVPVFHGRGGEDGQVQRWLDELGVRYVFSGPDAHDLGMDKNRAKGAVMTAGVRAPTGRLVNDISSCAYHGPVVVKPNDGGSSIGVTIVKSAGILEKALAKALSQSEHALVEDHVEGDEYTVLVAETPRGIRAFPPIAIRPKNAFFDWKSKYDPKLVEEVCPAPIGEELTTLLREAALRAHDAVGCRHVSRADFIVDGQDVPWFLEINTIPGMTVNSLIHKALGAEKVGFGDLLSHWIEDVCSKRN